MTRGLRPFEWVVTGFVFGVLVVAFNNCGGGFNANQGNSVAGLGSPNPGPGPEPGPSPGGFPPNRGGTVDANCLNNTAYDACLVWKNPVVTKGSAYPTTLTRGTNIDSEQIFGVTFANRISLSKLQSTTINVSATTGTAPTFVNGQLRTRYADDTGKSWIAQMMAYFWLTHQEQSMKTWAGTFYASGKNIQVDALLASGSNMADVADNAYFSSTSNKMVLGYVSGSTATTVLHEMALSGEVYLHEMGHANLHHALSGSAAFYDDPNATYLVRTSAGQNTLKDLGDLVGTDTILAMYCKTNLGCSSGLNEGQADFHAALIFPEKPALGETIENKLNGSLMSVNVPRDPVVTFSWTSTEFFNKSGMVFNSGAITVKGEIHGDGAAYGTALWRIYNTAGVNKAQFAKVFSEHLKMLTASSRFTEGRDALMAAATMLAPSFGGTNYSTTIQTVFTQMGFP